MRALLLGALYPPAYWILAASAALRSETVALVRGPREQRVVWDIPRERVDAGAAPREERPVRTASSDGGGHTPPGFHRDQ